MILPHFSNQFGSWSFHGLGSQPGGWEPAQMKN